MTCGYASLSTLPNLANLKAMHFLLLVALFLSGCLNIPRSFHALRYKDQKIYIDRHHFYRVGPLADDWIKADGKNPGIVFKHRRHSSKIATEALCGGAFEDLSLKMLTNHFLKGLEEVRFVTREEWMLSQRKALYSEVQAGLDGVPVALNIVVTKKDRCEFDFMSIAPLSVAAVVKKDFLEFVKGFDY